MKQNAAPIYQDTTTSYMAMTTLHGYDNYQNCENGDYYQYKDDNGHKYIDPSQFMNPTTKYSNQSLKITLPLGVELRRLIRFRSVGASDWHRHLVGTRLPITSSSISRFAMAVIDNFVDASVQLTFPGSSDSAMFRFNSSPPRCTTVGSWMLPRSFNRPECKLFFKSLRARQRSKSATERLY